MSEENKAVVRRFNELFEECWRTGNADILDEVLAPEFVYHSPGAPPDLGGFKQSLLMLSAGLHDLRYTVEDLFAEGDKVADRLTWQATHQGELMGIPPTGNTVRGEEPLRTIGFKPRRCSSSHQSSTLAVGYFSLSLITLIGSLFESLLLVLVSRCVMRPWNLGALLKPLQILPAPLLLLGLNALKNTSTPQRPIIALLAYTPP